MGAVTRSARGGGFKRGYNKHDTAGRDRGNSRGGHRAESVLTEVGPVEIEPPWDRDGSFEPKIVAKRQHLPSGPAARRGSTL